MTHRLDIEFARAEGAVLRLIGLVERKGFEICAIDMAQAGGASAQLHLSVTPRDTGRRIEVLSRHLEKVYGVISVRLNDVHSSYLERAS
jgi:acetolactate synthase regulatory subunit